MPIYDYRCTSCGHTFSQLVFSMNTPIEEIECPECGEHEAEKLLSMKSALIGTGKSNAGSFPGCTAPAGSGFV